MKRDFVIGVLGGMGTYATIHLFRQYAELFPAKKEWDRPRIIIDNRCTMPSRVRAYLYNENTDVLVSEMAESLKNLMDVGCNRIILDCNTSHLFLPKIYETVPELRERIINIIDNCVKTVSSDKIAKIKILGSEGTIESGIYQNALEKMSVTPLSPSEKEYSKLRTCIEAVKQDNHTDESRTAFLELVNSHEYCILGCTELPILYEQYKSEIKCKKVYDPLYLALNIVHEDYIKYYGSK